MLPGVLLVKLGWDFDLCHLILACWQHLLQLQLQAQQLLVQLLVQQLTEGQLDLQYAKNTDVTMLAVQICH